MCIMVLPLITYSTACCLPVTTITLYKHYIAQWVSALDFNFERAVGGSILTAGKKV